MNENLYMQIGLRQAPDQVFAALTESKALEAWFCEHSDVSLPDHRYDFWGRFTPEAPGPAEGHHPIRTINPGNELSFGWQFNDREITVAYRLYGGGSGTVLHLEQSDEEQGSHNIGAYTLEDFWFLSLENLRRFLDGRPAEARVDFSLPLTGDIRHSLTIDAQPQKVFEALIRPDQLERWIASRATVEPRIGGQYDFGWEGFGPLKIVELQENRRLAYNMPEASDPEGGVQDTLVTWTLEESGGKTRLTLVHSGFDADQSTGGLHAGWLNFMNWVRSLCEYGPEWAPPVLRLRPGFASYYARSISERQAAFTQTSETHS